MIDKVGLGIDLVELINVDLRGGGLFALENSGDLECGSWEKPLEVDGRDIQLRKENGRGRHKGEALSRLRAAECWKLAMVGGLGSALAGE